MIFKATLPIQIGAMLLLAAAFDTTSAQSPTASPRVTIPDEATAIRVAEAVLTSAYTAKDMEGSRPYKAHLSDGVWLVWGTVPKDAVGEPLFVQIDQARGCILRLGF
jgi:hypothetical protein